MIKIGTRGSKLALWQAYHIQELLEKKGVPTEIVTIETKGDKILDKSLSKIGSKGVFTEELENALRNNEIQVAVHSAKDVPSELPEDLPLVAFTEREEANDVMVTLKENIDLTGPLKIGTSSTRRRAFVQHHYPKAALTEMRGNLQTRFSKLENGVCDVMILAYAGVHRMGYDQHIIKKLPTDFFVPPVGQGSVALQVSSQHCDAEMSKTIREACNHAETEKILLTERSFLYTISGGCSVPTFAHATLEGKEVKLQCGIISLDGKEKVEFTESDAVENGSDLGKRLAEKVLKHGGEAILKEIKKQL